MITNLLIICFEIFYKPFNNSRENFLRSVVAIHRKELINAPPASVKEKFIYDAKELKKQSLYKTFVAFYLSLGLLLMLIYVTILFCSAFYNWKLAIFLSFLFVLIWDFILMEIIFELFILLTYRGKSKVILKINRIFVGIKSLRNNF